MLKNKVNLHFPLVLVGFALLIIFISSTGTLENTDQGQFFSLTVGAWRPWLAYMRTPTGSNWNLNIIAPSFLAGLLGLWVLRHSIRPVQEKSKGD